MTKTRLLPFAIIAALALSGCGIKGELETPPPVWGDKSKTAKPIAPDTDT